MIIVILVLSAILISIDTVMNMALRITSTSEQNDTYELIRELKTLPQTKKVKLAIQKLQQKL